MRAVGKQELTQWCCHVHLSPYIDKLMFSLCLLSEMLKVLWFQRLFSGHEDTIDLIHWTPPPSCAAATSTCECTVIIQLASHRGEYQTQSCMTNITKGSSLLEEGGMVLQHLNAFVWSKVYLKSDGTKVQNWRQHQHCHSSSAVGHYYDSTCPRQRTLGWFPVWHSSPAM